MSQQIPKELKFKIWPGNQFDFSDKELFQVHEDLCEDLEIGGYSEEDVVKISVGIWAGLRFAQVLKDEIAELKKKISSRLNAQLYEGDILRDEIAELKNIQETQTHNLNLLNKEYVKLQESYNSMELQCEYYQLKLEECKMKKQNP